MLEVVAQREAGIRVEQVGRLGEAFVDIARRGALEVAAWEDRHGDARAAAMVRAYAGTLHARSTGIPTWVANPTIGAVASRQEASRVDYWLRENGSYLGEAGGLSDYVSLTAPGRFGGDIRSRLDEDGNELAEDEDEDEDGGGVWGRW